MDPFLLHASLMIMAWLVLLPAGAMIARFCKVMPRQDWPLVLDNQFWWWLHRVLQYSGVTCALAGLFIAVRAVGGIDWGLPHVQAGLLVVALALCQVVSTWFRGSKGGPTGRGANPQRPETWRGDHYDMTLRRRVFEAWHRTFGWLSILLAAVTIMLGLRLYGWPSLLSGIALLLLLSGLAAFALLARLSRRIGTYQAIWGPDPVHPGNRRRSSFSEGDALLRSARNQTAAPAPASPAAPERVREFRQRRVPRER
jgi:hypothetical protein